MNPDMTISDREAWQRENDELLEKLEAAERDFKTVAESNLKMVYELEAHEATIKEFEIRLHEKDWEIREQATTIKELDAKLEAAETWVAIRDKQLQEALEAEDAKNNS